MFDVQITDLGLRPKTISVPVIPRGTSFVKGEVACFDFSRSEATTTNALFGDPQSIWTNVTQPADICKDVYPVCVFLKDAPENVETVAVIQGFVEFALVQSSVTHGDRLTLTDGNSKFGVPAAEGDRIVAVSHGTGTEVPITLAQQGMYGFQVTDPTP